MKTYALAGNPNCGKTTLFNQLTGSSARVGNWPGVTIDRKEGRYKRRGHGEEIHIIDLPGIYSLSPYTPEEVVSRNYIIHENPDLIINIVDATNLERNLYLTTQLMELGRPIVVALNMTDQLQSVGIEVDMVELEKRLGVPVIPVSALHGTGLLELMSKASVQSEKKVKPTSLLYTSPLGSILTDLEFELSHNGVHHSLYHAIKLLENDELANNTLTAAQNKSAKSILDKLNSMNIEDAEAVVADARYKYITKEFSPLVKKKAQKSELSRSDKIDKVLTNRVIGIPVFLGIMFLVFHLVFGETLFGIEAIPGPGVFLQGLTETFIGWIGGGIESLLALAGASDWVYGLIIDGIVGGVGAVLSFIPQILLLFLFLSIMEDSGYMARIAFIMDRLLRRFGLSGKSFIPMLTGFGCSIPGMMATRTLENEKDRRLTTMLIPFMSCGAKMPIYAIFAAALFAQNADIVVFGMYILGILVAVIAGVILKKTVFKQDAAPFIMELPTYHLPNAKSLLLHLWEKLKGFVIRAGTVILIATIAIWFLSSFDFSLKMVESNSAQSILGLLGNFLRPVFVPLGFASGEEGWKAVVAILTGLIAKEAVVSTLGVLYDPGVEGDALEDESASAALIASIAAIFSPLAALSFMAFNLLSVPCMAAVSAMRGEMRSAKWTWFTIAFWVVTAWVVSFLIFNVGTLLGF